DSAGGHGGRPYETRAKGSVSAALIAAIRAAPAFRDRADSLELVIVSPFTERSFDAATAPIRRLWPGRARLVRTIGRVVDAPPKIVLASSADDPLRAAIALLGPRSGAEVRVARAEPSAAD